MGLLFFGASVALYVEEARGIGAADRAALLALAVSVLGAAGVEPVVDQGPCAEPARCVEGIRRRTGASDVVRLRILGVPTRIRVDARRVGASGYTVASGHADLSRDRARWQRALEGLALILFPPNPVAPAEAPPPPPVSEAPPAVSIDLTAAPAPAEPGRIGLVAPLVVGGAGLVVAAAGFAFGASSDAARRDVETMPHSPAETTSLLDRTHDHGLAATVLVSAGAVAVVTGVILLLVD